MQKHFLLYLIALFVYASACTPKVGVLRSPDYTGSVGAGKDDEKPVDSEDEREVEEKTDRLAGSNIALVLPFQLNQIAPTSVAEEDVKRAALALDFYQGFQLGLEESTKDHGVFLNVLDSRDDNSQNANLAQSAEVQGASVIVGPVYPKEIKTFGAHLDNKNILQINPLAATMPSEFNLPNLVSLTPAIKAHSNAIAAEVGRQYKAGDVVIVYNTPDNDGRQFLQGMVEKIRQSRNGIRVLSVSSVGQLNENLNVSGLTHVVAGTTDKLQIRTLVNNLTNQWNEGAFNIRLYGHPLWDRYDWNIYPQFSEFQPKITTESALKNWTSAVQNFKEKYVEKYGIQPSDHSFKGYDCAKYFSALLSKYDVEAIKDFLVEEPYRGLYSNYAFTHHPDWGYANIGVVIRVYEGNGFRLQ